MPVSLPDEVESGDEAFGSGGTQFASTSDGFFPQHFLDDFEHLESGDLEASNFPSAFPGSFAAQCETIERSYQFC